jgi:hypothetical protein
MPADNSTLRELTEEEIAAQRAYEATIEPPAPINVFQDPKMNDAFIMLNPERRAKILQMDRGERLNVMKGIMDNPNIDRNQTTPWELPWQLRGPPVQPPASINIFQDPNMNAAFNMINGERQAKILQMEPELRRVVVRQIMLKSGKQSNNLQSNNLQPQSGGLADYFNDLPVGPQLAALQVGYKSMSNEFSKMANKIETPLTTIVKPVSMQEQLTGGRLSMLSVEPKDKMRLINSGVIWTCSCSLIPFGPVLVIF